MFQPPSSQAPTSSTGTIRILIVEDYKLTRVGLKTLLNEEPNLQVVGEADDGEKGVDYAIRLNPDVILMDLGLPGINGTEATQRIKQVMPNVKVIVLTSHDQEPEVIASFGAGANAYCLKDISADRLIEVIRSVHEGAAWLDPAIASVAFHLFAQASQQTPVAPSEPGEKILLTEREREVLKLLVDGKSNAEIAEDLIISFHTAKAHVCNILQKLAVNDRVQAAVKATKEGLV